MLTRGRGHEHSQARPGHLRVPALDDGQGVCNVGAAPAIARIGHLKIPTRRRFATPHVKARRLHVQAAPRLVLGQDAGDVVVQHHHLVGQS